MPRAPTSRKRITIEGRSAFHRELQRRATAYFEAADRDRGATSAMWLKTAVSFAWLALVYILYLTLQGPAWLVALLAVGAGLGVAGLGFNVMHDGSHQAYSRTRPWINGAMAASLDLLGGSSYVWNWKHNVFHHTYPNIEGLDDDIAVSPMARLAPSQPRYRFHSLQWLYMWGLYSFLALKWHFLDDFRALATGRLGEHQFPRPRSRDLVLFAAGKLLWLTWMVVLPLLLLDWTSALLFFLVTEATTGFVLSIVFQLAHCVEEAQFEALPGDGEKLRLEFATHQLRTTVDFAPGNRLLTWLVGGLNFQVVHHLFPRVCHVHYPALSRIVGEVSAEFGVAYHVNATFRRAVASHFRWLRRMGRPVLAAA